MHQMRISTHEVSSVVLRPKKLEYKIAMITKSDEKKITIPPSSSAHPPSASSALKASCLLSRGDSNLPSLSLSPLKKSFKSTSTSAVQPVVSSPMPELSSNTAELKLSTTDTPILNQSPSKPSLRPFRIWPSILAKGIPPQRRNPCPDPMELPS